MVSWAEKLFDGCIIYKVKHSCWCQPGCFHLGWVTEGLIFCWQQKTQLFEVMDSHLPWALQPRYIFCATLWIMLQELNPFLRKSVWKNELFWNDIAEPYVCKF